MASVPFNRRRFLKTTAAASAAAVAAPYIRTSYAAGSLAVAFWDHWVPGANDTLTKLCKDWAAKEKVDIKIDYITSQGNKDQLTIVGEAQARSGHDILQHPAWFAQTYAKQLEPVDDVMEPLIKKYGKVADAAAFLAKSKGHWIAVPAVTGTQVKPPLLRLDLFKKVGIDILEMYPVNKPETAAASKWNWDTMLSAGEKLKAEGHPIGLGLGQTTDSIDWVGAMFHSFGADLVDAKGNILVKNNDAVKQVLEYSQRLVKVMPQDVFAWDDASNNKYIISGQGSMIMNPPSAYAVAKRDNPARSPRSSTRFPIRPARRAASRATCPTCGAPGTSRRTSRRRRACSRTCCSARTSRSSSRRASATTCLRSRACATSRSGKK